MGDREISGGFDRAAVGERVAEILTKPTVNITDQAHTDLVTWINSVSSGCASASEIQSLSDALTSLANACCIFNLEDKKTVRDYVAHLDT